MNKTVIYLLQRHYYSSGHKMFSRSAFIKNVLSLFERVINALIALPYIGFGVNIWLSMCAGWSRLGVGNVAARNISTSNRPKKALILYQYEGCPFCRRVRETLSILAIDVLVYPCPRTTLGEYGVQDNSRYRPRVTELTGKCIFPVLVDPNRETNPEAPILESLEIVKYLWKTYGQSATPDPISAWALKASAPLLSIPALFRCSPRMGLIKIPSRCPKAPLELYSTEHHAGSRVVRELMDSMEIPYLLINLPAGVTDKTRAYFSRLEGKLPRSSVTNQTPLLPYLVDINTGFESFHPSVIMSYLTSTYATGEEVKASWGDYSTKGASAAHGTLSSSFTLPTN